MLSVIILFHIINRLIRAFIINAAVLTLFHCDMFQSSKTHLQRLRNTHFNSKVNKMSYQMYKIQLSEQRVKLKYAF